MPCLCLANTLCCPHETEVEHSGVHGPKLSSEGHHHHTMTPLLHWILTTAHISYTSTSLSVANKTLAVLGPQIVAFVNKLGCCVTLVINTHRTTSTMFGTYCGEENSALVLCSIIRLNIGVFSLFETNFNVHLHFLSNRTEKFAIHPCSCLLDTMSSFPFMRTVEKYSRTEISWHVDVQQIHSFISFDGLAMM